MSDRRLRRLAMWVAACLVCVCLPLLLAGYGWQQAGKDREREIAGQVTDQLREALIGLRGRADPVSYLEEELETGLAWAARRENLPAAIEELRWTLGAHYRWLWVFGDGGVPLPVAQSVARWVRWVPLLLPEPVGWRRDLARLRKSLGERFPGICSWTVVDRLGRLLPEFTDGKPDSEAPGLLYWEMLEKGMWRVARNGRQAAADRYQELLPRVATFTGPQLSPQELVRLDRGLVEIGFAAQRAWLLLEPTPSFGAFVWVRPVAGWERMVLADVVRKQRTDWLKRGVRIGWFSPGEPESLAPTERQVLLQMIAQREETTISDGEAWGVLPIVPGLYVWAHHPLPGSRTARGLGFALVAAFLLGTGLLYRILVPERAVVPPLRLRLTVLFGFAAGLPLLLVLVAGRDFTAKRLAERTARSLADLEAHARQIDAGFPGYLVDLGDRLTRELARAWYDRPQDRERVHLFLERVNQGFPSLEFFIGDGKGKKVWSLSRGRSLGEGGKEALFVKIGSVALGAFNQDMGSLAGILLMDLAESFVAERDILGDAMKNLGRFFVSSMGKKPNWLYNFPLRAQDGRAAWMVTGRCNDGPMEEQYLVSRLNRDRPGADGPWFLASDRTPGWWACRGNFRSFERVDEILSVLHDRKGTVAGQRWIDGQAFLYVAIRPKHLETKYLVALCPEAPLRAAYHREVRLVVGFVAVWGLANLFLGFLLARRFLAPIRELEAGVRAIDRRQFQVRLRPGDDDEFGDLMTAFNQMVGGLQDLDVARAIQESLLPAGPLETGEWTLFGNTRPVTQLGGDYYDLMPLPDGRVLLLIGDVMGHGVPAALIMAMARSLVVARAGLDRAAGIPTTAEGVLQYLQDVIFTGLKMKRVLTCLVGIVDPPAGTVQLANAGHNYPYVIGPGRPPERLVLPPSFPLAARRKAGFAPLTVALARGSGLLFYTDGFMEAPGSDDLALGYDRCAAAAAEQFVPSAPDWYSALTAWHRAHARPGPQEDDITLLLVCRN